MAKKVYMQIAGSWRGIEPNGGSGSGRGFLRANINGDWALARTAYVNVNGVWKPFHERFWGANKFYIPRVRGRDSYWRRNSNDLELYAYDSINGGGEVMAVLDSTIYGRLTIDWSYESNSNVQSDAIISASATSLGGSTYMRAFGAPFGRRTDTFEPPASSGTPANYFLRIHATSNAGVKNWSRVKIYRIIRESGNDAWNGSDTFGNVI